MLHFPVLILPSLADVVDRGQRIAADGDEEPFSDEDADLVEFDVDRPIDQPQPVKLQKEHVIVNRDLGTLLVEEGAFHREIMQPEKPGAMLQSRTVPTIEIDPDQGRASVDDANSSNDTSDEAP